MRRKKYKDKLDKKKEIELILVKTVALLLVLSIIIYTSNELITERFSISVKKGELLKTDGKLIFKKFFPPNSDAEKAYEIVVSPKEGEYEVTIQIKYKGELSNVYANNSYIDNKTIYIFSNLSKEETYYITGDVIIEDIQIYDGIIEFNEKEEEPEKNNTKVVFIKANKTQEVLDLKEEEYRVDSTTMIIIGVAVVLLLISAIIVFSLSPRETKRPPPIKPGEIIFDDEFYR